MYTPQVLAAGGDNSTPAPVQDWCAIQHARTDDGRRNRSCTSLRFRVRYSSARFPSCQVPRIRSHPSAAESCPAGTRPMPHWDAVAPQRGAVDALLGRGRASARRGRCPMGRGRASLGRGDAPVGRGRASLGRGDVPVGRGRASVGHGRCPHADTVGVGLNEGESCPPISFYLRHLRISHPGQAIASANPGNAADSSSRWRFRPAPAVAAESGIARLEWDRRRRTCVRRRGKVPLIPASSAKVTPVVGQALIGQSFLLPSFSLRQ